MKALATLFVAALALPAAASPFDLPPERYDETVNPALERVGLDLRISQIGCPSASHCSFAARQVGITVTGPEGRSATDRISVEAMFGRGADQAAKALFDDSLTVLGATMMAYDPGLAADRRSDLLFRLGDAALSVGEAHEDSADVHYAVSFDNTTGRLTITVATFRAGHG